MKIFDFNIRIWALTLAIAICFSFAACSPNEENPSVTDGYVTTVIETEVPTPEVQETIDLTADGKLLYTIVRPETPSQLNLQAALAINNRIRELGFDSKLSDWGEKSIDAPEILVGETQFFPSEALEGIDLSQIGAYGFVIRSFGGKIVIAGANDVALSKAADYFITNYLEITDGEIRVPKDLLCISSGGIFLSEFRLNGALISEYALVADAGAEDARDALVELFNGKSFYKLAKEASKRIRMVIAPEVGDKVSAKFENGDLVIKAKDAEAMKKAAVCFWYENIAYAVGSFDLPASLDYTRDLSKTVFYSDFGVTESDNKCCIDSLIAAHSFANEKGYKVFADYGAEYYVASTGKTVIIKTDVEWGNAKFTIDDSGFTPENRGNWIFEIAPTADKYTVNTLKTLDKNTDKLDLGLTAKSLVVINDTTTKQYFRVGVDADSGQPKRDITVVDTDGTIAPNAPLAWDFDNITSIDVYPIDLTPLTVSGGEFTTVANRVENGPRYYARGIHITRSNTNLAYVKHFIVDEDSETSAPYTGFVTLLNCAYVNVEGCVLSGHKYFSVGTYDIGGENMIAVTFKNCWQANDIHDKSLWGIMGTNYCKDVTFDSCELSRFDTHRGVTNATIKNSIIGQGGITVSGSGTLLLENTVSYANSLINLRDDYGSPWDGDIVIRNCSVYCNQNSDYFLIKGTNSQDHDFGYTCYMPKNVTVEGLHVDTKKTTYLFKINTSSAAGEVLYPYIPTESVTVKGFSSLDGNMIKLGHEDDLLKNTVFKVE